MLPVQSSSKKYFASGVGQIAFTTRAFCSSKGRFAIVTNAGRNAVDAAAFLTNSANADGEGVWS